MVHHHYKDGDESFDLVVGGKWVYEPTGWFPDIAPEGALWPLKPGWLQASLWFCQEWWNRLCCELDAATDLYRQRTLWKRHPWLYTGNVWWRPYAPNGLPVLRSTIETFNPINGMHRWNLIRDLEHDFAFIDDDYWDAKMARRRRKWWLFARH